MKTGKRIASVVLMIMMLVTMVLPALGDDPTYTITINGAVKDETYTAYKIFDAVWSSDETKVAYTINSSSAWFDVILKYMGGGTTAVTANTDGNYIGKGLTLQKTSTEGVYNVIADTTNADATKQYKASDFAAYLIANKPTTVTADATATAAIAAGATTPSATLTITGSDPEGYYLVDSTVGILCALDTLNTTVAVNEKNSYPSVTKTIANGQNIVQIGDTVDYTVEVLVPATVDKDITVHDVIESGLTFVKDTDDNIDFDISIKEGTSATLTANTDYVVATNITDGCSFEIVIKPTAKIVGKTVVIKYSAKMNKDAELDPETNDNKAWITYSQFTSQEAKVETKTLIAYVQKTDESGNSLAGAKFKLYDGYDTNVGTDGKNTAGNVLKGKDVIKVIATDTAGVYRVADATELADDDTAKVEEMECDTNGKLTIQGLDDKKYYLEETEAPVGYNKLDYLPELDVKEATKTEVEDTDQVQYTYSYTGITVENQSGTKLPATGGIGTTIFYCAGAALTLGALVILITKKRMQKQ